MVYVLIVNILVGNSVAMTTAEFNNAATCQQALKIEQTDWVVRFPGNAVVFGTCFEKGTSAK